MYFRKVSKNKTKKPKKFLTYIYIYYICKILLRKIHKFYQLNIKLRADFIFKKKYPLVQLPLRELFLLL